jgi:hypothetical protein
MVFYAPIDEEFTMANANELTQITSNHAEQIADMKLTLREVNGDLKEITKAVYLSQRRSATMLNSFGPCLAPRDWCARAVLAIWLGGLSTLL